MLADCKCGVGVEAKLDVKNNKVICTKCFEEIEMSDFFKKMMKDRGEIYERRSLMIPPGGLQYTCDSKACNQPFSAEINKKDGLVYCPHCKAKANIAPITLTLLKENKIFEGYTKSYYENDAALGQALPNEDQDETPKKAVAAAPKAPKKAPKKAVKAAPKV